MPGHKDWFQIVDDPWSIKFDPYPFKELSLDDAADHTARLISEKFDNIYLGLSGGYDSEYVAKVLIRNKIPFTPIICKDSFSTESDYALRFCAHNNLSPLIMELNFFNPVFVKILGKLTDSLPGKDSHSAINVLVSLKVRKLKGHLLTGNGVSSCDPPYPLPAEDSYEFTAGDFYIDYYSKYRHPGAFFTYTPEICYSYMKNFDTTLPTQEAKSKIYNLNFRSKIKLYHILLLHSESLPVPCPLRHTGKMSDLLAFFDKKII